MPTKHNKKRYQREEKPKKPIVLSGNIFLEYVDDDALEKAKRGDLKLFASCKELHAQYMGAYDCTGFVGYFKVDVFDDYRWQPVIITELFPNREHYFTKSECPIDTYKLCTDILKTFKGKMLMRTYREHYELMPEVLPDA